MVINNGQKNDIQLKNNYLKKKLFSQIFCCIFYQHFFNSIIVLLLLNLWLIRHKINIKEVFRISNNRYYIENMPHNYL